MLDIIDWRALGMERESNELVLLPSDSRLRITIGETPQERVDMVGRDRLAYQFTVDAKIPDAPGFLDFADAWIDAETGQAVQTNLRAFWLRGSNPETDLETIIRSTFMDRPTVFLASLMWNRTYAQGDAFSMTYPEELGTPRWPPKNYTLRLEVERLYEVQGVCWADVIVHAHKAEYGEPGDVEVFRLVFQDDTPLPVQYHADIPWGTNQYSPPWRMQLLEYAEGNGSRLSGFHLMHEYPESAMTRSLPEDGFLAGTAGVFRTDYPTAIARAKEDIVVRDWLAMHPSAVPYEVDHTNGPPDGQVVDEWIISWTDGANALQATITRRNHVVPVLEDEYIVRTAEASASKPPIPGPWVTLAYMANLHERMTGQEAEILECDLRIARCDVGTHQNTGRRYAGEGGAGFRQPGLMVWLTKGWITQFDGRGMEAVGPAAWEES